MMTAANFDNKDSPSKFEHYSGDFVVLCAPQETRFDLRFSALGFPVRVSVWFWLGAVLLSPERDVTGRLGVTPLLIWVGVVFISILMHELGHALMFRRYGRHSHIVLHVCGGFAQADSNVSSYSRAIKVSLAGPAMNFLIATILWATNFQFNWASQNEYLALIYYLLYWMNLCWGLINLIPVWPLDGGQICRSICYIKRVRDPLVRSLQISIGTAIFLIALGLLNFTGELSKLMMPVIRALPSWFPTDIMMLLIPGTFWILFLALLAYNCFQELQMVRRSSYGGFADDYGDRYPWQR